MIALWGGFIGAGLILFAFVLNQFHVWKDTYFIYDFFNFLGAGLLVWYGVDGKAWPFVILNGVWALVSLHDCFIDLRRNSLKKEKCSWPKWMH